MDGSWFYDLFKSILVILGRLVGVNETLSTIEKIPASDGPPTRAL